MKEAPPEGLQESNTTVVSAPNAPDTLFCEQEPIHRPGAIQPHGAVIAALAENLIITHASANLAEILGRPVHSVLGRPLADAIGAEACRALLHRRRRATAGPSAARRIDHVHFLPGPDSGTLYVRAFVSDEYLCLDIEPMHFEARNDLPIIRAQSVLETFKQATNAVELCQLAASGLKEITGYDRVLAYRFAPDGHGEVIAEAHTTGLEPYLGQHYPATDIPPQARRLYLRQRVGSVADSAYVPVELLVDPDLDFGAALDLTESALRSISPVHREYMRNMGTAASLTIGIADGPQLWGMLVCHNTTPRIAGPELRAAAHMIGQVVSLLQSSLTAADVYAQRLQRNATLGAFIEKLAKPAPLPEALASASAELIDVVAAAGVMVSVGGTLCGPHGTTPDRADADRALIRLKAAAERSVLAIDDLGLRYPELRRCTQEGSGALFLPLASGPGDAILWFRPELSRVITWGGNPSEHAGADAGSGRLSPRLSFAAWKETVAGRAAAWTDVDQLLAAEAGRAIENELARRTRLALAESEALVGLLADHSGDVIILTNIDGIRRYVSAASLRVLGWRCEELVGRPTLEFVHPEDRQAFIDSRAQLLTTDSGESSVLFRHLRGEGTWMWVESRARLLRNVDGALPNDIVVVLRDATERKASESNLRHALEQTARLAATDGLTGLANRRQFDAIAARDWGRCAREHAPLSMLLADADRFKQYNDRYGHLEGDNCLCAIAAQIAAAGQRPADLAARYGGEEFVLLMPDTAREGALEVAERARRLVLQMGRAHESNGVDRVVTVSIGVASCLPGNPASLYGSVGALLQAADEALYRAKGQGRNQVVAAA